MISERPDSCFVWIWLPGEPRPVVAGKLQRISNTFVFVYGKSYLARHNAIAVNPSELPLGSEVIHPRDGMLMPSSIRDGAPDAWGRRVILNKIYGKPDAQDHGQAELDEMTYLMESGSDRIGALDFQASATTYTPRQSAQASLDELMCFAEYIEKGIALTPELEIALNHGSSIGGARPKALIDDGDTKFIAKFSSSTDEINFVGGEFLAMRLASHAGLDVAPVKIVETKGKSVLLVQRFDRVRQGDTWSRRLMSSALTLLGLDEMQARYCSYEDLADIIRTDFLNPRPTLHELFCRLTFNILCGNTDDHGRNHAAFFDGRNYQLTPAYDICPQIRNGGEATQAMRIKGERAYSSLGLCLSACEKFQLTSKQAGAVIEEQLLVIRSKWHEVIDEVNISKVDQNVMKATQWLNPYAFYELDAARHAHLLSLADEIRRNH